MYSLVYKARIFISLTYLKQIPHIFNEYIANIQTVSKIFILGFPIYNYL